MGEIWKPNACPKLRIKKRNSFSGRIVKDVPLSPLSNILGSRLRKTVGAFKRKNPFQCESNKLKCAKFDERLSGNKENEFSNFRITQNKSGCLLKSDHEGFDTEINFENSKPKMPTAHGTTVDDTTVDHQRNSEGFPTDWSLKTKVKFKSERPFSWCTNLKSSLSSRGTVNFVRCVNALNSDDTMNKDAKFKVDFRKNLSYWKHPNLPCVPNFPLSDDDNRIEKSFTNICKDVAIRENIIATWTQSFQSVFTLARCGYCPYFYMCSQKFSCLFIGTGVLRKEMIAIVTPTTKGLRGILHKEGIEFEMPHLKSPSTENPQTEYSCIDTENGIDDTDEEFLSSIGLSKKQFSSIEKQRFANELSQLNFVDNRAQSTVLIRDCHVNALFNFFVNSDVIVAQSGAFQGVPPTLLAPVAFEGASLQTLQCIQGPVKVPCKGGMKQICCLEVSGPVLPTQLYSICQLVKEANGSFEATVYNSIQSNAFNCMSGYQYTTLDHDEQSEFGINRGCLEYLRKASLGSNEAITQLHFSDGNFEWKMHTL